jgi:hypothetical protein
MVEAARRKLDGFMRSVEVGMSLWDLAGSNAFIRVEVGINLYDFAGSNGGRFATPGW